MEQELKKLQLIRQIVHDRPTAFVELKAALDTAQYILEDTVAKEWVHQLPGFVSDFLSSVDYKGKVFHKYQRRRMDEFKDQPPNNGSDQKNGIPRKMSRRRGRRSPSPSRSPSPLPSLSPRGSPQDSPRDFSSPSSSSLRPEDVMPYDEYRRQRGKPPANFWHFGPSSKPDTPPCTRSRRHRLHKQ